MARRDASLDMVDWASAPQQPLVSTAKGIETHPSSAHLRSLFPCFRTSAAIAADPLATPASVKVVRLSGEVTVRSKADGLLNPVLYMNISWTTVSFVCSYATTYFTLPPRHARWQNCEKASLKLLWHSTTSPPPLHITAWCPRWSSWCSGQYGLQESKDVFIPSHHFNAIWNSSGSR